MFHYWTQSNDYGSVELVQFSSILFQCILLFLLEVFFTFVYENVEAEIFPKI